jgi:hypothetical protein
MNDKYDIILIEGNSDVILVKQGYCKKCADAKLKIIRVFEANCDDLEYLVKYRTRRLRNVPCDCRSDAND